MLKYYGNDVVKATEFVDIETEYRLIQMQMDWLKDDECKKLGGVDTGVYIFFGGMWQHLFADFMAASEERDATGISLHLMKDGEYHVCESFKENDSATTKPPESSPLSAQNAKVENDNASTRSPPESEGVSTEVEDDSSTTQRLASTTAETDIFPPATETTALLPVSEADTSSSGTATTSLLSLPETHGLFTSERNNSSPCHLTATSSDQRRISELNLGHYVRVSMHVAKQPWQS